MYYTGGRGNQGQLRKDKLNNKLGLNYSRSISPEQTTLQIHGEYFSGAGVSQNFREDIEWVEEGSQGQLKVRRSI